MVQVSLFLLISALIFTCQGVYLICVYFGSYRLLYSKELMQSFEIQSYMYVCYIDFHI